LQQALVNGDWTAFDLDTVKMLSEFGCDYCLFFFQLEKRMTDYSLESLTRMGFAVNIFDTDRSGTIGFDEFAGLWKYIKDW
jgi:hypothetical protein